jgi:hypothetical protein
MFEGHRGAGHSKIQDTKKKNELHSQLQLLYAVVPCCIGLFSPEPPEPLKGGVKELD